MDYLAFYELEAEPFRNQPDPRFYYETRSQQHARLRLMRGLEQRRGLLVVLGPSGCGKTTLAGHLAATLTPKRFQPHIRTIPHSTCTEGWLLPEVARALGAPEPSADPARTMELIHQALRLRRAAEMQWVLILDEAQMLASVEVMEELRGLLNLQVDSEPLLSIVLLGLRSLEQVLDLDPSLAQRVDIRTELGPMDAEETRKYLAHRIARAGGPEQLLLPEAMDALASLSGGVPRVVNTLADNALFEAFMAESRPVGADSVLAAAEQLGLSGGAEPPGQADAPSPPVPEVSTSRTPVSATGASEASAEPPALIAVEPQAPIAAPPREPEPAREEIGLDSSPRPAGPEAESELESDSESEPAELAFVEEAAADPSEVEMESLEALEAAPSTPEASEDPADEEALLDSLLDTDTPATPPTASLEAPPEPASEEEDDLIDMAELLELEPEGEAAVHVAPEPAQASQPDGPAASDSEEEDLPRGPVIDGDLDDLFEQIQLED